MTNLRILSVLVLVLCTPLRAGAEVSVFAAASLKNALEEIAAAWTDRTAETVTLTFAASSTIARQVDQGAPVDIIVLANAAWMDWLAERGRLQSETRGPLVGNQLVLIAADPEDTPLPPGPGFPLPEALGDGHLAMALVEAVPVGIYGKAALTALGLWSEIAPQVAQTDNARTALALVATGEAPFGIVYASDALADARVTVAGIFPEDSHPPIRYPVALNAEASSEAHPFLAYLRSADAGIVLTRHGFHVDD